MNLELGATLDALVRLPCSYRTDRHHPIEHTTHIEPTLMQRSTFDGFCRPRLLILQSMSTREWERLYSWCATAITEGAQRMNIDSQIPASDSRQNLDRKQSLQIRIADLRMSLQHSSGDRRDAMLEQVALIQRAMLEVFPDAVEDREDSAGSTHDLL